MPLNTTGLPDSSRYVLGRARVFLGNVDSSTGNLDGGEEWIGNVPAFTINTTIEELTHNESYTAERGIDLRLSTSTERVVSFTVEEFSNENVQRFFRGKTNTVANPALGALTGTLASATKAKTGRFYFLYGAGGVRPYGLPKANVTIAASGGATLVEGTDYDYTPFSASVMLKPSATVIAAIGNSESFTFTTTAYASAKQMLQVVPDANANSKRTRIRIEMVNGITDGPQYEFLFPSTRLSPDGDLGLITENELAQMSFTGGIEVPSNGLDDFIITELAA